MLKQVIEHSVEGSNTSWLDLENNALVEITSEDPVRPIELAFRPNEGAGWLAAGPGVQMIRLIFSQPQRISRVRLRFSERDVERTQEFVLRWARDRSGPLQEIVRQQWNFSSRGSTEELEDYRLNLDGVGVLELDLNPDLSGRDAVASLDEFRVA